MRRFMPQIRILTEGHGMGSEDFAEFSQIVPCAHYIIGAATEQAEKRFGLHDPRIEFNEDVLSFGAAGYVRAAMDWLAES